jgi:hypothetical protein
MAIKRSTAVEKEMSKLDDVRIFFEQMKEKRQESFDNKSDKWKEGEKGEEEESNLSDLDDIVNDLQSVYDSIENLFEED